LDSPGAIASYSLPQTPAVSVVYQSSVTWLYFVFVCLSVSTISQKNFHLDFNWLNF